MECRVRVRAIRCTGRCEEARRERPNVCENVDLPEGRRVEMNGWGKGVVNEVSGRVEETSSGELKCAVRGRGWFAQLLCCCLVDLNMGVEFETAE